MHVWRPVSPASLRPHLSTLLSRRQPPPHSCMHCNLHLSTSLSLTSTTICTHACTATPTSLPLSHSCRRPPQHTRTATPPPYLSHVHVNSHHSMHAQQPPLPYLSLAFTLTATTAHTHAGTHYVPHLSTSRIRIDGYHSTTHALTASPTSASLAFKSMATTVHTPTHTLTPTSLEFMSMATTAHAHYGPHLSTSLSHPFTTACTHARTLITSLASTSTTAHTHAVLP